MSPTLATTRHFVWTAFLDLCRQQQITASEAVARLEAAFPHLPVEALVRAEGDTSLTFEQVATRPLPEPIGQGIQPSHQQPLSDGKQMAQDLESDINAVMRGKAGATRSVGHLTATDIMRAGTGKRPDGSGGYEPSADPFRTRFAERAAQRG